MAGYRWNDKEYEQIPYDDWDGHELGEVEAGLGHMLDGSSSYDIARAMFAVSVRRVEPEAPMVMLLEVAGHMKLRDLMQAQEAGPLEESPSENGHADPLSAGHPLSEVSE